MIGTKTVFTGLSMATILLFGGGIFLYMNLSNIAKPITERIATEALGVPVSIGGMKIDLPNKSVSVSALRIANPAGYTGPNALTVGGINVALGEVSKELITFKTIDVANTNVNLEVNQKGTNLNDLKKGISSKPAAKKSSEQSSASTTQDNGNAAPSKPGDQVKVIIDHFGFNGAKLNPTITLLSEQQLESVTVPDINLNGIGKKENGILAREAIAQIFDHILKVVNKSSGQAGFLQGLDKDALREMGQGQIDTIKDQVKDEVKNIGNRLKGIFGN